MRITATIDGDPFGKIHFSFDKDGEPNVKTMRAYAAAAELLRISVGRAIGRMREAAHSAGMGADFDAGIEFARSVGAAVRKRGEARSESDSTNDPRRALKSRYHVKQARGLRGTAWDGYRLLAGLITVFALAVVATPCPVRAQLFVAHNQDRIAEFSTSGAVINPTLIYDPDRPVALAISGNNLWVSYGDTGVVGLYSTSGVPVKPTLITGLTSPYALAVSGSDLFVLSTFQGTIREYDAITGAVKNNALVTGLPTIYGMVAWGSNILVPSNGTVKAYDATTGALVNSGVIGPEGTISYGVTTMTADNGYLYLTSPGFGSGGFIYKYVIGGGSAPGFQTINNLLDPWAVAISGSNIFVTSGDSQGRIGEYDANTGATINAALVTGLGNPRGIVSATSTVPEPSTCAAIFLAAGACVALRRAREDSSRGQKRGQVSGTESRTGHRVIL